MTWSPKIFQLYFGSDITGKKVRKERLVQKHTSKRNFSGNFHDWSKKFPMIVYSYPWVSPRDSVWYVLSVLNIHITDFYSVDSPLRFLALGVFLFLSGGSDDLELNSTPPRLLGFLTSSLFLPNKLSVFFIYFVFIFLFFIFNMSNFHQALTGSVYIERLSTECQK